MTVIGVVVPAWNEAPTIGETLCALEAQRGVKADVVVVANGCADATFEAAVRQVPAFASAGHRLRVLQIEEASKPAALNVGEALLADGPRAFIDADAVISPNALEAVARALQAPEPLLAAPALRFRSPKGRSGRIARLLEAIPPLSNDVVGGGFYAVNPQGRRRWDRFPHIIADDAFVCDRFRREERIRVGEATFTARFPSDEALVGVLARWRAGRRQLQQLGFALDRAPRLQVLTALLSRPGLWVNAAEFAGVRWAARRQAARLMLDRDLSWARAD